jgi:uncharacterized protein involved in exopolysaccharide biosynthesis
MNDAQNHDSQQRPNAQDVKNKARRQPKATASRLAHLESGGDQGNQDEISLAELWLKAKSVIAHLCEFKFLIMGVGLLFALGGYFKVKMAKPSYKASLVFALEQGGDISGLTGLASQFGFALGNSSGDGLGGDNLLTLIKSRRIIEDVLLNSILVDNDSVVLINQFVATKPKLKAKWDSLGLYPIDPLKCCSPSQDSAIGTVVKSVTEKSLAVAKVDKKQSFVTVTYEGHDEVFTGAFVELLTAKSTDFYVQTKMANARANIDLLERRVDSVSAEMQAAMVGFASSQDQNSFTVQSVAKVPSVQKQMKVTMLTTLYGELVKNLELSKTMSAREEPLITIIDRPHYPLRVRESKLKSAAIGGVLGVFLTLLFLGGRAFLSDLNKQAESIKQNA